MPTYDYECKECKIVSTITRQLTDTEIIPLCESCNQPTVRTYSWAGTTFKGTGFYSKDKGEK
jgi:putative FmdB family regulatory protein